MAKNGNKSLAKWAGIILTLILIGVGIVKTFAGMDKDIEHIEEDMVTLEVEGCKPADALKFKMVVVEKDVETIQTQMKEWRTEQKEGFEAIITEIRKK